MAPGFVLKSLIFPAMSRFFFPKENKRQSRNVITKLKDNDGHLVQRNREVLDVISSIYKSLYSDEGFDESKQSFLLASIDKILPGDVSQSMENSLSSDECPAALSLMKSDKSPGYDGL